MMRHAGRYNSKKQADQYADVLRLCGERVEVVPVTVYDVMVEGSDE